LASKILGDAVLDNLISTAHENNLDLVELTLRDFVAGGISGSKKYPKFKYSGVLDSALALTLMASADDLDDVDWDVLTHPGSVIWPVLLATHIAEGGDLKSLTASASVGYQIGRSIAKLFGPSHRGAWHITETAGAVAATGALSHYLNLSPEKKLAAIKMTLTNMSGSPQAGFERIGAAQSNRAAAVALAITSVKSAQMGAPIIEDIWQGPRGIVQMFNLSPQILEPATEEELGKVILPGTDALHFRVFFATGFVSSAIAAVLELLAKHGQPDLITIEFSKNLAGLLDGSRGGFWWDPLLIMHALVKSNNPFDFSPLLNSDCEIKINYGETAMGAAHVRFAIGKEEFSRTITTVPFKISQLLEGEIELIYKKWNKLSGLENLHEQDLSQLISELRKLLTS
jgi:2-methylcitrate dehydratase PrpD